MASLVPSLHALKQLCPLQGLVDCISLISSEMKEAMKVGCVPITYYGRANTQIEPLAVGLVLFLLFLILFFPNVITPDEKLGYSEQRRMMQYSANPIIYVSVKCVPPPPPLPSELLWNIYYFTHKGLAKGCRETLPWRLCSQERVSDAVHVTALNGFRRSWRCEPLNRYLHLTSKRSRQSLPDTVLVLLHLQWAVQHRLVMLWTSIYLLFTQMWKRLVKKIKKKWFVQPWGVWIKYAEEKKRKETS